MNLKFFKISVRKTKNGYVITPKYWTRKIVKETEKKFYFSDGGYVRKIEKGKFGYRLSQTTIFGPFKEIYTLDKNAKWCYSFILESYFNYVCRMKNNSPKYYIEKNHDVELLRIAINKFLAKYH